VGSFLLLIFSVFSSSIRSHPPTLPPLPVNGRPFSVSRSAAGRVRGRRLAPLFRTAARAAPFSAVRGDVAGGRTSSSFPSLHRRSRFLFFHISTPAADRRRSTTGGYLRSSSFGWALSPSVLASLLFPDRWPTSLLCGPHTGTSRYEYYGPRLLLLLSWPAAGCALAGVVGRRSAPLLRLAPLSRPVARANGLRGRGWYNINVFDILV
jgi:hypothetical protein